MKQTHLTEKNTNTDRLARGANIIRDIVRTLTSDAGVYRMLDDKDTILYIGKAKNLKKRVIAYTHTDKLPNRLQRMVSETLKMEIVTTHTETEALLLEANLIKKHQPRYNILLKDDKSFPYILITKDHAYPRILKHRGPQTIPGDYFGPFANIAAVDEAILVIQKVFKIRNCTDSYFCNRERPCLQHHIKRCTAPCVKRIEQEEYKDSVQYAKNFLLGKGDNVQKVLSEKMMRLSDELEFEKAAQIRDTLKLITKIQAHQRVNVSGVRNADVIAIVKKEGVTCVQVFFFRYGQNLGTTSFFLAHACDKTESSSLNAFITQFYQERSPAPLILLSHTIDDRELIQNALTLLHSEKTIIETPKQGLKAELIQLALKNAHDTISRKTADSDNMKKLFEGMQPLFDLERTPERIEIYDNSHLQGTHACGVMVVATQKGFDKKSYRKFNPKEAASNDDFGMMYEFLKRRFQHIEDWGKPDLLLIDGGQGQLSAVETALAELKVSIPVVGIAKGIDRNAGREQFFMKGKETFQLPIDDPFLHFLQRLRDEAHRFAIGTHRQKRGKTLIKSALDGIPGIGASRKKKLLLHFGSAKNVSIAAISDLERIEGISHAVAQKIYDYFHEK
ncbi:MAG: excinuclease ABC subunit UvrC [Candidatus Paracaedibacteraceae bacterium]|nr:excinuclease ABC subunit UvrC [Candidatus Paracaedibacteraceae bacterium]